MSMRFDHAVIAVPDIAAALAAYAELGFDVAAGGRHPAFGTHNAIVRFGLDYLELLAVEDESRARASGAFGADLIDFLAHGGGLVGFVLASDDLDAQAAALSRIEQPYAGPFAMDRERPDGRYLAWRLVIPGSSPWRKPWPFLINWQTPDHERLAWDAPGHHRNAVVGVAAIEVLVADLAAARRFYEHGLGLVANAPAAGAISYRLGDFELRLHTATDTAQAAELAALGPGPYRLVLRATDLRQTVACIGGAAQAGRLDILEAAALGARITVTGS